MKEFLLLFIISFFAFNCTYSQLNSRDREIIQNIDWFRKATVSIGIVSKENAVKKDGSAEKILYDAVGTGVCFYMKYGTNPFPVIVTAKHVLFKDNIRKFDSLRIRFPNYDSLSVSDHLGFNIYLDDDISFFFHPDPSIDLVLLLPTHDGIEPFRNYKYLGYNVFPTTEDFYEGKEVHILGYPTSVGYELMNHAILRRGIISWMKYPFSEKSKEQILIDAEIYPGNSGGPVFSITNNYSVLLDDTVFSKPKFLGIVVERRFQTNEVLDEDGKKVISSNKKQLISAESMGVGVVIPSFRVRELITSAQDFIDKKYPIKQKK